MTINNPPALNEADSALKFVTLFQKLMDPVQRKTIADDITAFHALNDTEAKKAADARDLIKKHTEILNDTKRISEQNAKDRKDLEQDKVAHNAAVDAANQKLTSDRNLLVDERAKAKKIADEGELAMSLALQKENELKITKSDHESEVAKLNKDKQDLADEKKKIDEYKKQVIALDEETKAKVAKLKQFNF